jgi:hypothetical protein
MGGQACVFYGAAQFSRDVDLAILAGSENLAALAAAFAELQAVVVAVPPFEARFLDMGLAVHFRCAAPGVENLRVDVMTTMRGVDGFSALWERRTTIDIGGDQIDMMSLPDLVQAKKTQRLKDWPMIQRLVEASWYAFRAEPTPERIDFWLRECRTPALLLEMASRYPGEARVLSPSRPVLASACRGDEAATRDALEEEQKRIMAEDRVHCMPLKRVVEKLRCAQPL